MNCSTPGLPVHHQLPESTHTHVHRVGDAIQSSHPLLSLSPPALDLSQHQGLFKWVSSSHQVAWPKYWSFSFNISPSNEHPGVISFRMDWLDLLAVQGTLKSLPWHHSSKALILHRSGFFIVQLSHPYMTTGKTIALTRQTFVDKVMSLLFNMLSYFSFKKYLKLRKSIFTYLFTIFGVLFPLPRFNVSSGIIPLSLKYILKTTSYIASQLETNSLRLC